MRLFLLPKNYNGEETLILTGKDYNYLVNVLRLKIGQKISARDRDGLLFDLTITNIEKNKCILSSEKVQTINSNTDTLPEDRPQKIIVLYQCLPKGRKLDEIIKRATEIGVYRIVLVKSKNCISDLEGKEDKKLDRLDNMIIEAVQQSGSTVPTKIEGIIPIEEVPEHFKKLCKELNKEGTAIFLHQCQVKDKQTTLFKAVYKSQDPIGIIVGPEGGFTETECSNLLEMSFKPVLLKSNILRCETASIYAISAVQSIVEETC